MPSISEPQVSLRKKLADNLRADSDAIKDHLKLVEYMVTDPETGALFTDTHLWTVKDVSITFDWGSQSNKDAFAMLVRAVELKIVGLLPGLCRDALDDAAKRSDVALARLIDNAPPDDATTLSKVLGTPVQPCPPPGSSDTADFHIVI